MSELEGRGAPWTEERTREPKGRPAVWTEERGGLCRTTREDGGLRRPGRPGAGSQPGNTASRAAQRAGEHSPGDLPLILMYHAVADVGYDPNLLAVSPRRFAAQLAWLARLGLRGVAVGTLVAALRAGRARGLVGITFDDGYVSVLENALPELVRRGFTATIFVISDLLGGHNDWDSDTPWPLLSGAQLGELAAADMEIGSHSATHIRLADAVPGRLTAEVSGSRERLSRIAEAEVRGFAYPYGDMDAAARRAVRDAGYDYACAVRAPRDALGLMALPRVYVGQRDGPARMTAKRLLFRHIAVRGNTDEGAARHNRT
jgi:peptidoglycan/xylan/chitin deacetylase (PgdA/CDA1 family)